MTKIGLPSIINFHPIWGKVRCINNLLADIVLVNINMRIKLVSFNEFIMLNLNITVLLQFDSVQVGHNLKQHISLFHLQVPVFCNGTESGWSSSKYHPSYFVLYRLNPFHPIPCHGQILTRYVLPVQSHIISSHSILSNAIIKSQHNMSFPFNHTPYCFKRY